MAHFEDECVPRPEVFNFATDVVDYWASKSPNLLAVHWVSRATAESRKLDYSHFSRQSHRIALMLQKLGIQPGQKLIIILPRIPAW
jgi:acyl-coenzyme A synthetase/AMP-(fatty) acid ligase